MESSTWETHRKTPQGISMAIGMQWQLWFRMGRVMVRYQGKGPRWSTTTSNLERRWLPLQRPPPEKRQKRGAKIIQSNSPPIVSLCRFDLSESTIRMWLRKADGLDYRGPSYNRAHAERIRFQGTLQVHLFSSSWSSCSCFLSVVGHCFIPWCLLMSRSSWTTLRRISRSSLDLASIPKAW